MTDPTKRAVDTNEHDSNNKKLKTVSTFETSSETVDNNHSSDKQRESPRRTSSAERSVSPDDLQTRLRRGVGGVISSPPSRHLSVVNPVNHKIRSRKRGAPDGNSSEDDQQGSKNNEDDIDNNINNIKEREETRVEEDGVMVVAATQPQQEHRPPSSQVRDASSIIGQGGTPSLGSSRSSVFTPVDVHESRTSRSSNMRGNVSGSSSSAESAASSMVEEEDATSLGSMLTSSATTTTTMGGRRRTMDDKEEESEVEATKRMVEEDGDPMDMWKLGVYYSQAMMGIEEDKTEACRWFRRAANLGEVRAMQCLGVSLINGTGVDRNIAEGMFWLSAAAHGGSDLAAHNVGQIYRFGLCDMPRDTENARFWLRKVLNGKCKYKHADNLARRQASEWLQEIEEEET